VLYNRGVYAAMLAAEAAKDAQEANGVAEITSGMMRDAMENLVITEERMAALGMPGFGPEFTVSCANHGGNGLVGVAQWDASAQEWNLVSDFKQSDQELITPLIKEDSMAFAAENNIEPRC
jgi:branched-chain amino acid transport system substrate-binding protein